MWQPYFEARDGVTMRASDEFWDNIRHFCQIFDTKIATEQEKCTCGLVDFRYLVGKARRKA
jgi:hypothetical protein